MVAPLVLSLQQWFSAWVYPLTPVVGLIIALVLSRNAADPLLKTIKVKPKPPKDSEISEKELDDALLINRPKNNPGIEWLGGFETSLFFFSFYEKDAAVIGAAWLAFKVAAKWASWQHVIKVPEKLLPKTTTLEDIQIRNQWGSWLLSRFLLGTLFNLICGLIGSIIAKLLSGPSY